MTPFDKLRATRLTAAKKKRHEMARLQREKHTNENNTRGSDSRFVPRHWGAVEIVKRMRERIQ